VIKIFKGTWDLQDTTINVTYSLLSEGSSTADTSSHRESLGIVYKPGDTLLRFNNQWYRRADKYDQHSQQTIEKYKIALAKYSIYGNNLDSSAHMQAMRMVRTVHYIQSSAKKDSIAGGY
jgi:hypothetical protein